VSPITLLAEIKESRVFEFIITITTPEQGRGVLWTGATAGRCTNFPAATGFRAPTRNLLRAVCVNALVRWKSVALDAIGLQAGFEAS
jgi:hypothetical protein